MQKLKAKFTLGFVLVTLMASVSALAKDEAKMSGSTTANKASASLSTANDEQTALAIAKKTGRHVLIHFSNVST